MSNISNENLKNQVIQENLKINEKEKNKIENKNFANKGENNSFNQLLSLQLLIQKHSGLKELCNLFYQFYIILFYKI